MHDCRWHGSRKNYTSIRHSVLLPIKLASFDRSSFVGQVNVLRDAIIDSYWLLKNELFRFQWSEAIYEFLPSIPAQHIHHFANTKDYIGDDRITIISYDLLVRAVDTFKNYFYGFIILVRLHRCSITILLTNIARATMLYCFFFFINF